MTKKSFKNLLIIGSLLLTQLSFTQVVNHQAAGMRESTDFKVWVNGEKVFTARTGDYYFGSYYSFCNFDFNGTVNVRVQAKRAIKWLDILPSNLEIKPKTIDDYTFEFTLDQPKKITILLNNDRTNGLHLLTNSIEKVTVDPKDENVIYYKGGEVYDIGVLDLKDNQTLYVESGARLKGMVRVRDAKNVKILGRGIIDGTDNKSSGNGRFNDQPWRLIYMENAKNIQVKGITLYNSKSWTLHPYNVSNLEINNINIVNWNFGSDGIDLSSCRDVKILNSFLRTNDDCIVVKAISFDKKMFVSNKA